MKYIIKMIGIFFAFVFANAGVQGTTIILDQVQGAAIVQSSFFKQPFATMQDSVIQVAKKTIAIQRAGKHAITLQWIGWDKPGMVTVTPAKDGWYSIKGEQKNSSNEYLIINGKIKRLSFKELQFDGIIETRMATNNAGEPCIKKGAQLFFAKGSRKYYRLQNMDNCEGNNLVDYVDIYFGTSGL